MSTKWTGLILSLCVFAVPVLAAPCAKTVTVEFMSSSGGLYEPEFATVWIAKNAGKKPWSLLCFSEKPSATGQNYLLVFSETASVFNGFKSVVHERTAVSTSTSPLSGSGTAQDDDGNEWRFTFDGQLKTTTRTTYQTTENVPYTDRTLGLYAVLYAGRGVQLTFHYASVTARSGGDAWDTAGHNLGEWLGHRHWKEALLKKSLRDALTY
jgi:hypothetical protein